jgi:hypothetical protein
MFTANLYENLTTPTREEELVAGVLLLCIGLHMLCGFVDFHPVPVSSPLPNPIPPPLRMSMRWVFSIAPYILGTYGCVLGVRFLRSGLVAGEEEPEAK